MKKMIFAATAALAVASCGGTDNGLKEKVESYAVVEEIGRASCRERV